MAEAQQKLGRQGAMIERQRLIDLLEAASGASVVLVTAPAGYGKSVLLERWTSSVDEVIPARISLDRRDNEAGRFWQSVVAAIEDKVPDVGEEARQLARIVTPASIELLVEALSVAIERDSQRIALVLDDFHLIDDATVLDSLDLFRDVCPSVQLILVGRHEPRLPVSRLRLKGELAEIREADLRFTIDETRELLAASGISLPDESIDRLWERIEGWPAAVRLATLSLMEATDPVRAVEQFHGTDRQMSGYLLEQVVSEMDPQLNDFAHAISAVNEMNGDLANALSGRRDAETILARWEHHGFFTHSLPGAPGWYRLHGLLRDLLLSTMRFEQPARLTELHGTAADWYREHGDGAAAVHHALEADRVDDAIVWLAEIAPRLIEVGRAGRAAELAEEALERSAEHTILLLTTRMMALYYLGREPAELDELMERLATLIAEVPASESEEFAHGGAPGSHVSASALPWVQGLLRRSYGDEDGLLELLNRPGTIPSPTGRVESYVGEGLMWGERYAEAEPLVDVYREHASHDQFAPSQVHGLGLKAMALIGKGELGAARAAALRGLSLAEEHGLGPIVTTWYARLMMIKLHWMATELEAAESLAVDMQHLAEAADDVPAVAQNALLRSRIRWSLGDPAGARDLLQSVTVNLNRPLSVHFSHRVLLAQAGLDLLEGMPGNAERRLTNWRSRIEEVPETMREWLILMRLLVLTDSDPAPVLAPPPEPLVASPIDALELIRIRAHLAERSGRHREAVDMLAGGLASAARIGATQPFIDDLPFSGVALIAAAQKTNLALPGLVDESVLQSVQTVYVEPLTRRELAVLQQMQTHLSYPEIADELYVSTNTIKSHAKAIFRKLAVSHRSDAVAHARAYGLLD